MKILLLAGEESGQIYARGLSKAIKSRIQNVEIRGYGDYGFETHDLAVMGLGAVLKRLPYFLRVRRTMERALTEWRPDLLLTVDYPGMNLRLAAKAKQAGIRAIHVVCPQVWAWKQGRIPKIEAALDHLCCFFPFEPQYFRQNFATFVGHPLVEECKSVEAAQPKSADAAGVPTIALLPGSRKAEIERILPLLLEAAQILSHSRKVRFVIPAATQRAMAQIVRIIAQRTGKVLPVSVQLGGARELLRGATCAAVASGTATLEAALARCPTVLVYKVSKLFELIFRRLITGVHFIGLANIIWEKSSKANIAAERAPMPELIQDDFTPEALAVRLARWLDDAATRGDTISRLDSVMSLLTAAGNPYEKMVDIIQQNN